MHILNIGGLAKRALTKRHPFGIIWIPGDMRTKLKHKAVRGRCSMFDINSTESKILDAEYINM